MRLLLVKDEPDLGAAVKRILTHEAYIVDWVLDGTEAWCYLENQEYFMKHPNQIVTREQIMNQLWEIGAEPISNVVAAQMRLLRRKLALDNSDEVIETVYGIGYRLNTTIRVA